MLTFDVKDWFPDTVSPKTKAVVGVDLPEDMESLDRLYGAYVTLRRGERTKLVKVTDVGYPIPMHLPPYRKGEGIALNIEFDTGE